jgi:hypothetical protein
MLDKYPTITKKHWIVVTSIFVLIFLTNLTALFTFEHIRVGVVLFVIIVLYMVLCVHTMTNANPQWQHAYCLLVLFVASALVVVGVASKNRSYVQYPFIVSIFFYCSQSTDSLRGFV